MPKRLAVSTLNASTIDIMNVIRANAPYDYQQNVPKVVKATDIPKVGEVIYGTPAFANAFINALVNRIALVRVNSSIFNNPYSRLKKGYLEFGESVEEIFVNIAKVVEYDPEKAEARELKRWLPDVQSAFHVMNWRVMYPVTIQDQDLKQAFLSINGVQDLIAKIVDSVYTATEYDEFLLFKYLLVKAISHGKLKPIQVGNTLQDSAVNFRGISNLLPFMSSEYNEAGVLNTTPKSRQVIFMDAMYNARYDVEVLASAFNMDKADFMGSLFLIDNWTTFDNERFNFIRQQSDGIEEVTAAELALLQNVQAVSVDEEWFQVYDNNNKFTEKYIASGLYWNYFYHTWKTISHSPFANAVTFVSKSATITPPETLTAEIVSKDESKEAIAFGLKIESDSASLADNNPLFLQTEDMVKAGIGITPYGALYIPISQLATNITLQATLGGVIFTGGTAITGASVIGDKVTLSPPEA